MRKIVLASRSIGRKKLFEDTFGKENFEIKISEVDEESLKQLKNDPLELAHHLALLKARAVADENPEALIFGFDTVVVCEGRILGKPADKEDAKEMLASICGKKQQVISGWAAVCRSLDFEKSGSEQTLLFFHSLSEVEIAVYVDNHPVTRFAGGYGVQDKDELVEILEGRMDTVIGAPMNRVSEVVREVSLSESL